MNPTIPYATVRRVDRVRNRLRTLRLDERQWHDQVVRMLAGPLRAKVIHTARARGRMERAQAADDWLRLFDRTALHALEMSHPQMALFLSRRLEKSWWLRLPGATVRVTSTPLGDVMGLIYHLPRSTAVRCTVLGQDAEVQPWSDADRLLVRMVVLRLYADYARGYLDPVGDRTAGLSERQLLALRHLLDGQDDHQIGRRMCISAHTVHTYIKAIYRHFGVTSRGQLLSPFIESLQAREPQEDRDRKAGRTAGRPKRRI